MLRLVADDLTGALDTAAEFVPVVGPVTVAWHGHAPAHAGSAALDLGTREADAATAEAAMARALPFLRAGQPAFKKIDSLIRGQTLPELAACMRHGGWAQGVLAPAFPFQGRTTRGAQQWMATPAGPVAVGPDLVAALGALGIAARRDDRGALQPGVTVCDAETDADLAALVARVGAGAPVLWCGTGGLAHALAQGRTGPAPALPGPALGLFGSDQAVTAEQLARCGPHWHRLPDGGAASAALLAARLGRHGVALATHTLPPGTGRDAAAARIGRVFAELVGRLDRPGTLIVAGGETLRGLCIALGAGRLEVRGRVLPGVPVSVLRGGAWDGVTVVSKSGAFGHPALLRDLLRPLSADWPDSDWPDPERTAS